MGVQIAVQSGCVLWCVFWNSFWETQSYNKYEMIACDKTKQKKKSANVFFGTFSLIWNEFEKVNFNFFFFLILWLLCNVLISN